MKKVSLILFISLLALVGCQNKKTASKLEGTWAEIKIDGVDVPLASADKIVFGACKNRKKENCKCTIIDASTSESFEYNYHIDDKGKQLILKVQAGFLSAEVYQDIIELTDDKLIIDWGNYIGEYIKS